MAMSDREQSTDTVYKYINIRYHTEGPLIFAHSQPTAPTIQTLHPSLVHEIPIGQQRSRPQRDHILRVQNAPTAPVVPAVRDALAVEALLGGTVGGALALGQAIERDVRIAETAVRIRFVGALVDLARPLRALVLDVLLVAGGHAEGVGLGGFVFGAERTGAQLVSGVGQNTYVGSMQQ